MGFATIRIHYIEFVLRGKEATLASCDSCPAGDYRCVADSVNQRSERHLGATLSATKEAKIVLEFLQATPDAALRFLLLRLLTEGLLNRLATGRSARANIPT